jgi:hyperosmotically inducible periplasmic protein
MRNHYVVLSGLLIFLLLSACNEKQPKNDEQISESVTATTRVIDQNISVAIHDGVVTLNGEVADKETKTAAVNAVKHIEGVKSINDNLTVKSVTKPGEEMSEPDKQLKSAMDSTLKSNGFDSIGVSVANGIVTLSGQVTHMQQVEILKLAGELHPARLENFLTVTDKQQ